MDTCIYKHDHATMVNWYIAILLIQRLSCCWFLMATVFYHDFGGVRLFDPQMGDELIRTDQIHFSLGVFSDQAAHNYGMDDFLITITHTSHK